MYTNATFGNGFSEAEADGDAALLLAAGSLELELADGDAASLLEQATATTISKDRMITQPFFNMCVSPLHLWVSLLPFHRFG
jgi:hypothetical protein